MPIAPCTMNFCAPSTNGESWAFCCFLGSLGQPSVFAGDGPRPQGSLDLSVHSLVPDATPWTRSGEHSCQRGSPCRNWISPGLHFLGSRSRWSAFVAGYGETSDVGRRNGAKFPCCSCRKTLSCLTTDRDVCYGSIPGSTSGAGQT